MAITLNSLNSMSLEFGDRIAVTNDNTLFNGTEGVFVDIANNQLIWIATAPNSPTGAPAVQYTNLEGTNIEKLS